MCGIAGIFDASVRPQVSDLKPMVDIQSHRGPNADGTLVDGPVALGMRRLSIIDLEGGQQPIFNEDRSIAVVFNGEIYNYLELREELAARGHRFSTRSDTEVLVHLYEDEGDGFLSKLNGMFAFAIWDSRTRSVLLARDRMGVKPLYWSRSGKRWFFASELKALLTQTAVDTGLDLDSLADYLRLGYIPREATPYARVQRLLPGHLLRIDENSFQIRTWWDLADTGAEQVHRPTDQLRRELEANFDDAIRLRMRSDVPVASFLSGGLDSSLVTVTAQRESPIRMSTFTISFEKTEFDELPYARTVARQAGTVHQELPVATQDALSHLPRLVWHMDEPMGDSSIVPNYFISEFAARNVKVCLSGLGGDELFGGYPRYLDGGKGRIRQVFEYAPFAARALAPAMDTFKHSWAEELRLAADPALGWRSYVHRLQVFSRGALRSIGFTSQGRTEETVEMLWNRCPVEDPISRKQFVDQHTYLPDQILALTDRMSMANSLEVRVPFMDHRLVRFSQRIASPMKQTCNDFKIFLKDALGRRCPPELLTRPKWGFDTPLSKWVRQPGVFEMISRLPDGLAVREGLIRAEGVRRLTTTPEVAARFARHTWALLVLETWMRVKSLSSSPRESLNEVLT